MSSELLDVFAEFLNMDVASGDASADTLATYRKLLNQYLAWCEKQNLDPAAAATVHIKAYRRYLVDELHHKPGSVALKLCVLRRFYQAATERGLVKS